MSFTRRLVTMLTLVALLLPGLLAHPVSARQCLRVMAEVHCIEMANPVAKFADHAAAPLALLPEEAQLARPALSRQDLAGQTGQLKAQAKGAPRLRPPRA